MPCRAPGASPGRGSEPPRGDGPPRASRDRARTGRTQSPNGRACYTGRVPRVAPFRGLRFDPAVAGPLDLVTAPPYDVISGSSRERLRAASPYNIVHVDLGDDGAVEPDARYERAATLLREW